MSSQQQVAQEDPFGGKRYRKLKKAKNVNVSVEQRDLEGAKKLAFLDDRHLRDWIRILIHKKVEKAIKDGVISAGALQLEQPEPAGEVI